MNYIKILKTKIINSIMKELIETNMIDRKSRFNYFGFSSFESIDDFCKKFINEIFN